MNAGKGWRNNVKSPWRGSIHWHYRHHPAGTKLVRRFIRDAHGENVAYRKLYMAMTGREFT